MALFGSLGGLIQGGLNVLGSVARGTPLGTIGQFGSSVVSQLTQPTSRFPVASGPVAQPVLGMVPKSPTPGIQLFRGGAAGMATRAVGGILIKIATKLGRSTMSIRQALRIAKRLGRFLEPAAVATAMGITLAELGELILAGAQLPRRRMNPGNAKALRRAHRRVEAFHRLCMVNDRLRGGRRGGGRRKAACGPAITQVRAG